MAKASKRPMMGIDKKKVIKEEVKEKVLVPDLMIAEVLSITETKKGYNEVLMAVRGKVELGKVYRIVEKI